MQRLWRVFLVLSLLMGFCFNVSIADASPPIKIGIMYPLTGIMSMTGERMVKAGKSRSVDSSEIQVLFLQTSSSQEHGMISFLSRRKRFVLSYRFKNNWDNL